MLAKIQLQELHLGVLEFYTSPTYFVAVSSFTLMHVI